MWRLTAGTRAVPKFVSIARSQQEGVEKNKGRADQGPKPHESREFLPRLHSTKIAERHDAAP
jgi:hypothetical protein